MYFKEFSCNIAENMQARCVPRFIQCFLYAVIPTAAFCGVGEETGELKAAAAEKRTVFRGFCWLCDISHAVQRRKAGDSAFSFAFAHFGDTVGAGRTSAVCAANRAGGEAAATSYSAKRNTARAPRPLRDHFFPKSLAKNPFFGSVSVGAASSTAGTSSSGSSSPKSTLIRLRRSSSSPLSASR